MGVRKHRDGWQVTLRDRYILKAPDHATATMVEQHGKYLLALGRDLESVKRELRGENTTPTLRECFDEWTHTLKVSDETRYRYRLNFERIADGLSSRQVSDITTADISRATAALVRRGASPKTVRVSASALTAVLRYAADAGYITVVPAVRNLPKMERTREPIVITREQHKQMVEAAPEQHKALIAVLPYTGLRIGEALGLAREDVERDALHIRKQVRANSQERSKLKTPGSAQDVPLIPAASWWLDWQLAESDGHELVFSGPHGQPVSRSEVRRLFVDISETVGFDVRPHDLRHTAGSWMLAAGIPLADVSRFLRHKSVATTAGIYTHAVNDTPVMERFAEYLSVTQP